MSIEQANDDFITAKTNYATGLDHAARASEQCGPIAEQTGKLLPSLREFARALSSGEVRPEGLADTTKEMLAAFAVGHTALQQAIGKDTSHNPKLDTMLANSNTVNNEELGNTLTAQTARLEEVVGNVAPAVNSLLESLEWLHQEADRTKVILNITRGSSQQIVDEIKGPDYTF